MLRIPHLALMVKWKFMFSREYRSRTITNGSSTKKNLIEMEISYRVEEAGDGEGRVDAMLECLTKDFRLAVVGSTSTGGGNHLVKLKLFDVA